MKIKNLSSTLSCMLKCIRITITMINKKLILGLFIITLLGGCSSPTALLGPVYTLSSTGSGLQAGINYGSNELITMYTGKTPIENLKKINVDKKKNETNIQKKTLESEDFYILVKRKIERTNKIIKKTNQ